MFHYQSYLIRKGNEIYQQVRLNGAPKDPASQEFFRCNLKCTNISQLRTFQELILEPWTQTLKQNPWLYDQSTHVACQTWTQQLQVVMDVLTLFERTLPLRLSLDSNQIAEQLLILNSQKFMQAVVSLKVIYQKDFFQLPLPNFLKHLKIYVLQDYLNQLNWSTLKDETDFVNLFYQDYRQLKNLNLDSPLVYQFVHSTQYWVEYLKLVLVISFQILLANNFQDWSPTCNLNLVYEVLEKF